MWWGNVSTLGGRMAQHGQARACGRKHEFLCKKQFSNVNAISLLHMWLLSRQGKMNQRLVSKLDKQVLLHETRSSASGRLSIWAIEHQQGD
jgi:hypothetical protein